MLLGVLYNVFGAYSQRPIPLPPSLPSHPFLFNLEMTLHFLFFFFFPHHVQFVLLTLSLGWARPVPDMVSLSGVTSFKETDSPFHSCYQRTVLLSLWWDSVSTFSPLGCDFVWLNLTQVLCIPHNCYEIMCLSALCLENIVSLILATTSGSYNLCAPPSENIPEPLGGGVWYEYTI